MYNLTMCNLEVRRLTDGMTPCNRTQWLISDGIPFRMKRDKHLVGKLFAYQHLMCL